MRGFGEDDDWSRLRERLRVQRTELLEELAAGNLDPGQYHNRCGYVAALDRITELIREIRSGEDLRAPVARPPLPRPED